ncbi:hypothetical protein PoB_004530200 [Plakobranchus ocellatus]|uniref:ShKT domain-containing protein n=1 Tax=Plakobranchus ocellatus TaxID=259542 RepID=A0AAV4BIP2_9GAST|nr:hypothetical protein PoB_004530200 [Plakobranchus ocellatus]
MTQSEGKLLTISTDMFMMMPGLCNRGNSLHVYLAILMVIFVAREGFGCFPMQDVFKDSCLWIQTTSMGSRNRISICNEKGTPMIIESEGIGTNRAQDRTLECLRVYNEHRYLVKVYRSKIFLGYQCLKFSSLTDRVVRQEKTAVVAKENKLNCEDESLYTADEAVLIASLINDEPKKCVLSGGFQLLMHMGGSSTESLRCQENVQVYNPRIQFQCDEKDSPNVLIDLGKACTPQVLWDSQSLRGRYVAHLRCLDSWQENKGTPKEFTTLLLAMRDSPRAYWCLHVKQIDSSGSEVLASSGEVLYQAFLTLDGRCVQNINGYHDVPKDSTMFGTLSSFVPRYSNKCKDDDYLRTCERNDQQSCFESLNCPSSCGRCKKKEKLQNCTFPTNMRGSWESFSHTDKKPALFVKERSVQSYRFGEFECRYPKEFGDVLGLYALVQSGVEPSCMPYYSCAQLISLAPGLLSFQMRPTLRDVYTGEIYSCQQTHEMVGFIRPEKTEETVTLLQKAKLKGASCNINKIQAYPTEAVTPGCQMLIHECYGACQLFHISLEAESCNNMTATEYGLNTQHTCLAEISLNDGSRALLTKLPNTEEYFCWLFVKAQLLIIRPDACNQNRIDSIFKFESEPQIIYDPLLRLLKTSSKTVSSNNKGILLGAGLDLIGVELLVFSFISTRQHFLA